MKRNDCVASNEHGKMAGKAATAYFKAPYRRLAEEIETHSG